MTSYYDIENCYKFILGRSLNKDEKEAIGRNLLQLADIPLEEHRKRFLSSAEFHQRHGELLFNNFVPKSVIVLFETKNDFKMYLDLRQYHISFGIMSGEYERFDIDLIKSITPDDGHFIDVGGNVGYYSLSMAARPSFRGKILAFEPLPTLHSLFERSVMENGFNARINVRRLALAEAPGKMQLSNAEETVNAGATRLIAKAVNDGAERVAQVETLDRVVGELRPDTLKVDIEGAEGLFLKGATLTLAKHRPTLLMEINRDMLTVLSRMAPGEIHQGLQELGYNIWNCSNRSLKPVATASALDIDFPNGAVANILAVHKDRMTQVRERLQSLNIELERPRSRRGKRK
ncbi:FkbM family methyltransferase [Rhizobium petrolearium]|uniref:FkbM family methyltransferase n=1 Tax=Neorhizobium petrolearium TaxID=515361 RepID=UPI001AE1D20A|nr:FkbM family methyltransferase [Neorhizobium petrolearium]MBP1843465.1 FkbM family methyltransferase [Neorhizobium petrolearium]